MENLICCIYLLYNLIKFNRVGERAMKKLLFVILINFFIIFPVRGITYRDLVEIDTETYEGLVTIRPVSKDMDSKRGCSLSLGNGMYKGMFLGSAGILIHPLDNFRVHSGVGFGDDGSVAGYAGISLEFYSLRFWKREYLDRNLQK